MISIVAITHNEGNNLRLTIENLRDTLPSNHEIIVVDDCSTDGSADFLTRARGSVRLERPVRRLGVSRARNYGARRATGGLLIFCDAHMSFPSGWYRPMVTLLEDPLIGAVAPCISDRNGHHRKGFGLRPSGPDLDARFLNRQGINPYPVPFLPGACMSMRSETFHSTGGFDRRLIRYGVEDCELSLRFWLSGYELWVIPDVDIEHQFRTINPYGIDWPTMLHNRLRMAFLHLSNRRLQRVMRALKSYPGFAAAMTRLKAGDVLSRRSDLQARRKHNDDWFFARFGLNW